MCCDRAGHRNTALSRIVRIDVALMFKKREAGNLGGLRYVFGQNLGLGQGAVVR
jgi:hypothetical protein